MLYDELGDVKKQMAEDVRGWKLHRRGDSIPGRSFDIRSKVLLFDGLRLHAVEEFSGERFSVVAFTSKMWRRSYVRDDLEKVLGDKGIATPRLL